MFDSAKRSNLPTTCKVAGGKRLWPILVVFWLCVGFVAINNAADQNRFSLWRKPLKKDSTSEAKQPKEAEKSPRTFRVEDSSDSEISPRQASQQRYASSQRQVRLAKTAGSNTIEPRRPKRRPQIQVVPQPLLKNPRGKESLAPASKSGSNRKQGNSAKSNLKPAATQSRREVSDRIRAHAKMLSRPSLEQRFFAEQKRTNAPRTPQERIQFMLTPRARTAVLKELNVKQQNYNLTPLVPPLRMKSPAESRAALRRPEPPRQRRPYRGAAQYVAQGTGKPAPAGSKDPKAVNLDAAVPQLGTLFAKLPAQPQGAKKLLPNDTAAKQFPTYRTSRVSPQNDQRPNWQNRLAVFDSPMFHHNPLYFEQVNVERYGNHHGFFQPAVSAAHFFGSAVILPYKIGAYHPWESRYTLGHYRPGDLNPNQWHRYPLTVRGVAYQTLTVLGLGIGLP